MKTIFALLIVTVTCIIPGTAISQPKFNLVGGTHFDFGDLFYGSAKKILTIRNDGTDTLVLTNISASCGCTGTLMSNDHLAPNDSGALSITFNTKNMSGHAEKAVSLNTNDPEHKNVRIVFSANVTSIIDIQPEYLYYQTKLDTPATQTIKIKNSGTSAFHIVSVTSDIHTIELKLPQTKLIPNEETTLTATLTPKTKGTFKGNIVIKTDHPKVPSIEVRVVGLVIDRTPRGTATH